MNRRKKVTMSDIAMRLDVSIVTVSKALAGKDGVGPELRRDILELAKELGYVQRISRPAEDMLPGLEAKLNHNIGILVPKNYFQNSNSYYFDLYQMLVKQLVDRGHFGIVEIVSNEEDLRCKSPHFLLGNHVAGIIVLGQFSKAYVEMLRSTGVPLICLDFNHSDEDEDAIVQDNITGGFMATEHLILQGHKKIAFLGSIRQTTSIMDRYLGYHKALLTYGLAGDYEYIIEDRNDAGIFLEMKLPEDRPTAVFSNSDESAYLLMKQLEKEGIRVPEDLSIVGFDDSLYAKMTTPPLTTVKIDREVMCEITVQDILRKIEQKKNDCEHMRKVIKVRFCPRDSVAAVKH